MDINKLLPVLVCIAALLPACAGDEKSLRAQAAAIPAQQRDPEQLKKESASAGTSLPERTAASTPRGATDLGREAEKEEEELRKREKLPELQK